MDTPDNPKTQAEALFRSGMDAWKRGDRARAISDLEAATALDPDSPAATALAMAQDVMNFFNPDLLNP